MRKIRFRKLTENEHTRRIVTLTCFPCRSFCTEPTRFLVHHPELDGPIFSSHSKGLDQPSLLPNNISLIFMLPFLKEGGDHSQVNPWHIVAQVPWISKCLSPKVSTTCYHWPSRLKLVLLLSWALSPGDQTGPNDATVIPIIFPESLRLFDFQAAII